MNPAGRKKAQVLFPAHVVARGLEDVPVMPGLVSAFEGADEFDWLRLPLLHTAAPWISTLLGVEFWAWIAA